jgi:hypothetical protein
VYIFANDSLDGSTDSCSGGSTGVCSAGVSTVGFSGGSSGGCLTGDPAFGCPGDPAVGCSRDSGGGCDSDGDVDVEVGGDGRDSQGGWNDGGYSKGVVEISNVYGCDSIGIIAGSRDMKVKQLRSDSVPFDESESALLVMTMIKSGTKHTMHNNMILIIFFFLLSPAIFIPL